MPIEPGKKYVFQMRHNRHHPWNGQQVLAVHQAEIVGDWWRVQFADGGLTVATPNELTAIG